ncbi:hypothetical protein E2C01_065525 [Portunus trituberculatus]|uniref:Uncharacterized protein n=1 Tax=Portunus trituberculatus TaxID=210409 RepID=A0A5B7HRZ7_PORTR|nr:hypothetical protein [Portunus trituberculatus]
MPLFATTVANPRAPLPCRQTGHDTSTTPGAYPQPTSPSLTPATTRIYGLQLPPNRSLTMAVELLILGVGLYLGVYLSQQLSAGLPLMPGPSAAVRGFLLWFRDLYGSLCGAAGDERGLTGEIPPDQMPADSLSIEQLVLEELVTDGKTHSNTNNKLKSPYSLAPPDKGAGLTVCYGHPEHSSQH